MKTKKKNTKAWGGRFSQKSNELLDRFNASLDFDKKLYQEDIAGSLAHAKMLSSIGVLTKFELKKITSGLKQVLKEIESGKFKFNIADEDIHMAIESRLTKIVGPIGGKIHTARSRNDQVALDFRLYCIKQAGNIYQKISQLQSALIELASTQGFHPMPGYTHLQRAQPVYFAHHLLAYFEKLNRDKTRLLDYLNRVNECPLGAGALAGSTVAIDRKMVAHELGFKDVTHNSLDTVSDRDFVAELLFIISLLSVHLSRFSEELILWVSQEFQFIELPQNFCTGSSMMPQKVNPDVPELVRGKTGRMLGNLVSLLTTLKGLPLAYNKDMQEDKEPAFDSIDNILLILEIMNPLVSGIKVKPENMLRATKDGFLLATDMAEYLVTKKIPFREAHEIVGKTVQYCIKNKKTLEELSLEEFQKFSTKIKLDIFDWLNIENSINKRISIGGTSKSNIKKELTRAKRILRKDLK
jgi:argininosuccinate lyase